MEILMGIETFERQYDIACSLAERAGSELLRHYNDPGLAIAVNPDGTPDTDADKAAALLAIRTLRELCPNDRILCEGPDHGYEVGGNDEDSCWVVDQLDGTRKFIQVIPTWMFSIAYIKNGVTQVGVLYDPVSMRLYSGWLGNGANLNGQTLRARHQRTLANDEVSTSVHKVKALDMRLLSGSLIAADVRITNFGSTAYEGANVCRGVQVASISTTRKPWDIAAVQLIAEEAKCAVTNLLGERKQRCDQRVKGLVISDGAPGVHEQLLDMIQPTLLPAIYES
jgi:myo-inositol-1(or 4)-monophosphatase